MFASVLNVLPGRRRSSAASPPHDALVPSPTPPTEPENRDLHQACERCDWEEAERLIDAETTGLGYRTFDGTTILHFAVQKKAPLKVISKLVGKGVDPNAPTKGTLNTPVHLVCAYDGSPDVLKLLVEHGGDINRQSLGRLTPLGFAADCNASVALVQALLSLGAVVDQTDLKHWSPLFWAVRRNANPEVVRVLLQAGADPNQEDIRGLSPILYAAHNMSTSPEMFRWLLQYGGRLSASDRALIAQDRNKARLNKRLQMIDMMMALCSARSVAKMNRKSTPVSMLPSELTRKMCSLLY